MFNIKIADIVVSIDNKFDFIEKISYDYIVKDDAPEIRVRVSDAEIDKERKSNPDASDAFIESVCIYRQIAQELPKYNAFVLHCASIEYNGSAYCFLGKSGTGKTTHIKLWRSAIGSSVLPINGDKPIIRYIGDTFYVCGTPWGGKEMLQRNVMIPLKGLCELSQSDANAISRIDKQKALSFLLKHSFIPENKQNFENTVLLISNITEKVPVWHLKCNISKDAALTSFNEMVKE